MTWLYTLVFAGLLFSSHADPANVSDNSDSNNQYIVQDAKGDETERFEQTYPLTPNGRVSVSNVNGSIVVKAWDQNQVRLVAVKTADNRERLSEVEIKVDSKPDSLRIETHYGDWKSRGDNYWHNGGKLEVDYELTVPRGASLNEIETVNGSVFVSDFSNFTKVSAVNGTVKATNLRGTANLSTVNGEVFADFDRLEAGSKISLETVNGRVMLSIPSDSSAVLHADSVNGSISNEFGLPVRKGQYVGRDLYGRLGSGEVPVKLSSVNGALSIGRNKDGKNPSPATNLLQQKNKEDQDWDEDGDKDGGDELAVDSAKLNKDVAKAVRQSQKDAAVAMKKAQKDMVKIQIPAPVVKIDTEALKKATEAMNANIQAQVEASVKAQADALARMQEIDFSGMPRIEKRSGSISVKGIPKVTIEAPGCSVTVRGWDKQEVQYNVIRITDSRSRTPIQVNENHTDSAVNIRIGSADKEAQQGFFFNENNRVRVEVFVPKRSNLKITTGSEIRLDGVSGEIDLSGDQESIDVRDVDGKMNVSTTCGQVRVIGFHGEIDAKATVGNVYLEGNFDKLSSHVSDGTVVLTVPSDSNATIISNTEVESEGVKLIQEEDSTWRVGNGGRKYNFDFGEGHLIVRSASEISSY